MNVLTGDLVGADDGVDAFLDHGERAGQAEPGVGDPGGQDDGEESGEGRVKHF